MLGQQNTLHAIGMKLRRRGLTIDERVVRIRMCHVYVGQTRLDVLVRFILDSLENERRYNKIYELHEIKASTDAGEEATTG